MGRGHQGDTDQIYPVINKYAHDGEVGSFHRYNGEPGANNNYDTQTDLDLDSQDYISGFRGLGVDMYTISFSICDDQLLNVNTANQVLKNIATGPSYFYTAEDEAVLTTALKSIVTTMSTAATLAWFTDTLGDAYDLYIGQPETTVNKGEAVSTIQFNEYMLDKAGTRTGELINHETITILDLDGDGDLDAISNQLFNTVTDASGNIILEYYDIWNEETGLITGKQIIYNPNSTSYKIDLTGDGVGDYDLLPETFFWTIGVIGETEMVLEYPVYLTGSMEGEIDIPAGTVNVYDTNKRADLHYVNYLGQSCEQPTVPPAFPWGNPAVGYVFYLVDQFGNPLDGQGRTTTFAQSLKLSTAVYENLNTDGDNTTTITASEKLAATELGEIYQLYYPSASYSVVYNESWQNNGGTTTYVTNYGGAASSNAENSDSAAMNGGALDLEKTVVYFALMVKADPQPDAVVIDFGLSVSIDVLANDGFAIANNAVQASVVGVAKNSTLPNNGLTTAPNSKSFINSQTGLHGVLQLVQDGSGVQYTLNSMMMSGEDVFVYAAKDQTSGRYYYSTVTVIPATTIYYEDSFVQYSTWNVSDDKAAGQAWTQEGQRVDKDQA